MAFQTGVSVRPAGVQREAGSAAAGRGHPVLPWHPPVLPALRNMSAGAKSVPQGWPQGIGTAGKV